MSFTVTFISVTPIPNRKPDVNVTISPGRILVMVPLLSPPNSMMPPSRVMLHSTSVASPVPKFSMIAVTPNPPDTVCTSATGIGMVL